MAKKNIELLKRLRTRFLRIRHKKHFNIKAVAMKTDCGSAMCIAGHTLDLAGYKMRLKNDRAPKSDGDFGRVDFEFIRPSGRRLPEDQILRTAAKELGLNYGSQGRRLFHDWSLKTPKQAAKRVEGLIAAGG